MFLITGGTGNVGANLVRQLLDAGERVRVITRHPGDRSFPDQVEVVPGDLTRPETLPPALAGVDGAFLELLDQLAARNGTTAQVLPTVEEVTGRPAFTYAQWAASRAAEFDPASL